MKELHRYAGISSSSAYKLVKKGKRKMTAEELVEFKKENPKSKALTCPDGFGDAGLTYIKQINYERRLKKALKGEIFSRPTSWGTFLEKRAFDLIPDFDYMLVSDKRYAHKTIPNWTGMPDLIKPDTVGDIKCPYSLETFCDKLEALQSLETYKAEFEADYWQHISNACLLRSNGIEITRMEAVIYCPYASELADIQLETTVYDKPHLVFWICNAMVDEMPHLLDDCDYKNLNMFPFDIPIEDMDYLESRVIEANKLIESEAGNKAND